MWLRDLGISLNMPISVHIISSSQAIDNVGVFSLNSTYLVAELTDYHMRDHKRPANYLTLGHIAAMSANENMFQIRRLPYN